MRRLLYVIISVSVNSENIIISSGIFVCVKGLRLLWEVTGVSPGSVSSCVELLQQGHVIAIAPGKSWHSVQPGYYATHSFGDTA